MKKKLELPNITLIAATSVEIDQHQIALKISSKNIGFGAVKLLSSSPPEKKYPDIEYVSIPQMNMSGQNRLLLKNLHKYFETSHCLYVQADSFVVNASCWKDEFLDFDYIGAPWTNEVKINPNLVLNLKNTVGCGGFSLRSRKLLETTAKINFDSLKFPTENEDIIVASADYGIKVPAVVEDKLFFGTQFHPEKSGKVGSLMIKNFLRVCSK